VQCFLLGVKFRTVVTQKKSLQIVERAFFWGRKIKIHRWYKALLQHEKIRGGKKRKKKERKKNHWCEV